VPLTPHPLSPPTRPSRFLCVTLCLPPQWEALVPQAPIVRRGAGFSPFASPDESPARHPFALSWTAIVRLREARVVNR
jgi:hypothetical protein